MAGVACGKEDEPAWTTASFCQAYAERECVAVLAWCASSAREVCLEERVEACRQRGSLVTRGVSHPYDGPTAAACLHALSQVYRSQPVPIAKIRLLEDLCSRVFEGRRPARQPCRYNYDCQLGLVCARGYCGEPTKARAAGGSYGEGAACFDDASCLEHLRCRAGVCVARAPLGMNCNSDDECVLPAFCDPHESICAEAVTFRPGSPACADILGGRVDAAALGGGDGASD